MKKFAALLALVLFVSSSAFALDSSVFRDIERADEMKDLISEAEDVVKDATFKTPADAEEAKLIAAETQVYLSYVIVRQNALIMMELEKQKAPSK